MAEQFEILSPKHQKLIESQHVFFVGTAAANGKVNVSPKGMSSLAVREPNEILWLNLTGSGNETAAHLLDVNRMTLMWCAFEGPPVILRVYGAARAVYPEDAEWSSCAELIPPPLGARQYFSLAIDLVQTSCGYAVPLMDYREDRSALTSWAEKRGEAGIEAYWETTNAMSLDGLPTKK